MRKKSILSIIVIILIIVSYILFPNLTSLFSSKTPLYVNLQKDDLIKIQTLLKEKRFEYKIEGNSIYVNKDRIDEIKSVRGLCSTLLVDNRLNNNKAVAETNANTTQNTVSTNDTDNKLFYGTYETNANWVKDPTEPKNLLQMTKNNSVIKVKVKSIGEAVFLEKTTDFYDPIPCTPVEVIVEETLDGQPIDEIKTIYLSGGNVKVSDVMKSLDQGSIEKMGFDTLTKKQQETMYISYKSEYDYNLKPDEEYVLIVAKISNDAYIVVANGYGVFKEDKELTNASSISSKGILKNVITKKELTDKNGTVLKLK